MSQHRELKTDRMASIKNCKAERGPLNCRYHSGVIQDCMSALNKLSPSNINNINMTEQRESIKQQLEDNINQLLDIYTHEDIWERPGSKMFEFLDGTNLIDDDIHQLRETLKGMKEALKHGDFNGKTLNTYVSQFNSLIKLPEDTRTDSKHTTDSSTMPQDILQLIPYISDNLPSLPNRINIDGSYNPDYVSHSLQTQIDTWIRDKIATQLDTLQQQHDAYYGLNEELNRLYINEKQNSLLTKMNLKSKMNKADIKNFWEYITTKYPLLQDEYQKETNQSSPQTIKELEDFVTLTFRKTPKINKWIRELEDFSDRIMSDNLPPVWRSLAYEALDAEAYYKQLYQDFKNLSGDTATKEEIEDSLKKSNITLEPFNVPFSQQRIINKAFVKLFEPTGNRLQSYNTVNNITTQMRDLNVNWDAHIIINNITNPITGKTIEEEYHPNISTVQRKIIPNQSIQYIFTTNKDEKTGKPITLQITMDKDSTEPLIEVR